MIPATTKDPNDTHATIDKRAATPKTSNIKLRAAHRKAPTCVSPQSTAADRGKSGSPKKPPPMSPRSPTNSKWPFLMLSIRKPPAPKKDYEPRYRTVDKKYAAPIAKEEPIDFKKDLQEYISKKDQQNPPPPPKPVVLKLNSLHKMRTLTKDLPSPVASAQEDKFLFSSRGPEAPLGKSVKSPGRGTTSQHSHYPAVAAHVKKTTLESEETINEAKIISLEKLLERLKEKPQGKGTGLRISLEPAKNGAKPDTSNAKYRLRFFCPCFLRGGWLERKRKNWQN